MKVSNAAHYKVNVLCDMYARYMEFEETKSEILPITVGVPQGAMPHHSLQ